MMAPAPMPTPMPIFAPVERLRSEEEADEGEAVELDNEASVAELPLDVDAVFEAGGFVRPGELAVD
jgi:hypothetical protein